MYEARIVDGRIETGKNEKTNAENITSDHYYTEIFIEGKEPIIQDFLEDNALARIKIGETTVNDDKIPGIYKSSEYIKDQHSVEINYNFKEKVNNDLKKEYGNNSNIIDKINYALKYIKDNSANIGFQEAKDILMILVSITVCEKDKEEFKKNLRFCNLIKEDEEKADVVSIYEMNGKKFFIKGKFERLKKLPEIGEITTDQVEKILNQGYEPRGKKDKDFLDTEQKVKILSTEGIGKATINVPTKDKKEASKIEQDALLKKEVKTNEKEGESIDDN